VIAERGLERAWLGSKRVWGGRIGGWFEEECRAQLGVELDTLETTFWAEVDDLAGDGLPAGEE